MRYGSKLYDGKFVPTQATAEASPEFITELENFAHNAGAKDIKYVKVPQNAIFQDKGIPCEYAIVFTVEMDKENMSTAPSFTAFVEVAKGYKRLAEIGNKLAKFLRQNGYAAYPGTALGGITDYVHFGELAGLGTIGYHGMLITPEEGTRLRINTIYTNITNLPIETENDHFGCVIFAPCAKNASANARLMPFFISPNHVAMVGCNVLTMTPVVIILTRILVVPFVSQVVPSVRLVTIKSNLALKETRRPHNLRSLFTLMTTKKRSVPNEKNSFVGTNQKASQTPYI